MIAKYDFQAQRDKDLSFKAGDEIKIEKKRSNGWWIGYCNGKRGYFPHNYVDDMNESIIEKRKDSGFIDGLQGASFIDM